MGRHRTAITLTLLAAIAASVLAGCTVGTVGVTSNAGGRASASPRTQGDDQGQTYAHRVVSIRLGDPIAISGSGATVQGNTVYITCAGVHTLSGCLADGRIEIDTEGTVYLELDGVDALSPDATSAAAGTASGSGRP